ncbi:hypothetical protein LMJF_20_1020 [Leishmania major strain Friedlin]|uniref:Uncharacterized protein n=1 Tax=Leishmania major TaxID=5664 RepID=Q4QCU4_LEIMA|nr:hypothetical protein LMJF_20_1020 [Leishmania major strain Friedlin]CAG9573172.1 hypothetical_protein_-_conserved [Leishmania major strain Friedlin]CAJ04031.1 hypothetical protein LMJF_20_1020 [Leishmania major strain Friedlin]|eukprot:XP_001682854.1 hypothetical protein LMJF_20_1020 [Leishmania major strain Friedlin]
MTATTAVLTATMNEEFDDLELSTTTYGEVIRSDKLRTNLRRGGEYRISCSAFRHRQGSNSGSGGGAVDHRIHAAPHPSRLSSAPQQRPKQQTASTASPTAATTLFFGEAEAAAAVAEGRASRWSVLPPDPSAENVLFIPCPPPLGGRRTSMEGGDAELTSQQFARRLLDLPSFRPTQIALSFSTAAAERERVFPAPPAAAPPSDTCSLGSLALKHSSQRFANPLHPQQKPQRLPQHNSASSLEGCDAAAVAPASSAATLASGMGTRAVASELQPLSPWPNPGSPGSAGQRLSSATSRGRRCLALLSLPLEPLPPLSRTRATHTHAPSTSSPMLSSSPPAEAHAALAIASVHSTCVSGRRNSDLNATRVSTTRLSSAVGLAGPGAMERLSPPPQPLPQGLLSPTLRALPKGWGSSPPVHDLHNPASSAAGNSSQGVNSSVTATLFGVGVAARPASVASAGRAGPTLTPIGEPATDTQRENPSVRPLEAKVCALFSGSAYADVRGAPTELRVLRALPVARTYVDHAAVKAAVVAATAAAPSPGTHERGCKETPGCLKEAAAAALPPFVVPKGGVEAGAATLGASFSVCSTPLPNLPAQIAPMSFKPQQQLYSNTKSGSGSTDGERDGAACRISDVAGTTKVAFGGVSSPLMVGGVPPTVAATASRSPQQQLRSSFEWRRQAGDVGTWTAMSPESEVGATPRHPSDDDAVVIEEAVVPAAGISPMPSPTSLPLPTPQQGSQRAVFRFHSVLQRGEDHRGGSHLLSAHSSVGSSTETGEGWTPVPKEEEAVADGDPCGHGKAQGTELRVPATLPPQSAGAAATSNVSSKAGRFKAAHKRRSRQRGNREESVAGLRRESSAASMLASNSSRGELWTGLQLPRSSTLDNISFTNTAGQRPHSITSLMRRPGHEARMRHMNSDTCFGTFIPSVDSFRSFLEDHQSSFYLGNTTNDRSASSGTQSASPSCSGMRMRYERGKIGSSTRGHSQRKRESHGVDWAVASAASHQLSVNRDHDTPAGESLEPL